MHPELLNNSLFLKYYRQLQDNPSSIVFAPLGEFYLRYGMLDDALKTLRQGIERHPQLVSGHLVLTKVHLERGNWDEALDCVNRVLRISPENAIGLRLKHEIEVLHREERTRGVSFKDAQIPSAAELETGRIPSWETVTMANIYAAQGHFGRARKIYEAILEREPGNEEAKRGLEMLPQSEG